MCSLPLDDPIRDAIRYWAQLPLLARPAHQPLQHSADQKGRRSRQRALRSLAELVSVCRSAVRVSTNKAATSRRDGSPFLNLLMHSPLCDSSGNIRYFLGAQVDVSGVFSGGADLDSLQRATQLRRQKRASKRQSTTGKDRKHCFQQLSETFDTEELQAVCTHAGRILQGRSEDEHFVDTKWRRPGVLLREPSAEYMDGGIYSGLNSKLNGFYNHVSIVDLRCRLQSR